MYARFQAPAEDWKRRPARSARAIAEGAEGGHPERTDGTLGRRRIGFGQALIADRRAATGTARTAGTLARMNQHPSDDGGAAKSTARDAMLNARDRTVAMVDGVRQRLRLTWRGFVALLCALGAVAMTGVVLSKVSEDVLRSNGLEVKDTANLQFVTDHRSTALVSLARGLTQFGSVGFLVVIAVAAGVFLWFRGARLVTAVAPLAALLTAGALAGVGKVLVARQRPPTQFRLLPETDASFPSGHSTDSAALYLTLGLIVAVVLLRRPLARALTIVGAGLLVAGVGASRLILGVHWPTDVLAGWSLGATVAITVTTAAVLVGHLASGDPSLRVGERHRLIGRVRELLVIERGTLRTVSA